MTLLRFPRKQTRVIVPPFTVLGTTGPYVQALAANDRRRKFTISAPSSDDGMYVEWSDEDRAEPGVRVYADPPYLDGGPVPWRGPVWVRLVSTTTQGSMGILVEQEWIEERI